MLDMGSERNSEKERRQKPRKVRTNVAMDCLVRCCEKGR